jgi:hypothetical protein
MSMLLSVYAPPDCTCLSVCTALRQHLRKPLIRLREVIYDLLQDMDLIFYNCELYNGTVSEVGKHGVQVKKVWVKAWQNSGLDTAGKHSFLFFSCENVAGAV